MTIPADSVLGITDATYSPTIMFYQAGAAVMTFTASGVTLLGQLPTIQQYGVIGLMRTGANTWSYL